ncbi:MAG TPA: formate dehydrogenase accessory sulfurtransferase FdhD [Thermomicrobiales bacterium]
MDARPGSQTRAAVVTIEGRRPRRHTDVLATEEPLEIRLDIGQGAAPLVVTMRTPGADFELAAGFLFSEGIVRSREEIKEIRYCVDRERDGAQQYNVVTVELRQGDIGDRIAARSFTMTGACGVCGKSSLDALSLAGLEPLPAGPKVPIETLYGLPETLRERQRVFARTGGLHAAALFDASGKLLALREDIGRHNALDKLVGWALLEGRIPLRDGIILVSGRASYELTQKTVAAGAPILCAVSAPSSLAVALARRFNLTLVGFLRGKRANVYHGLDRLQIDAEAPTLAADSGRDAEPASP